MASSRSSRRVAQRPVYAVKYDSGASLYPFTHARTTFEHEVHALNQQSFPTSKYARMDDIAVYMLFRKKRSGTGRLLFQPEQVSNVAISSEDTEKLIAIAKQWPLGSTSEVSRADRAREMAHAIAVSLPKLVEDADVAVMQQCVYCPILYSLQLIRCSVLHRYMILYRVGSMAKIQKVSFDGKTLSGGVVATQRIVVDTAVLELCGSLSSDVTDHTPGLSVIESGRRQLGPRGPRLILGPFRFVNHDCEPNCQVSVSSTSRVRTSLLGPVHANRADSRVQHCQPSEHRARRTNSGELQCPRVFWIR